jgi:hypothetical protein
VGEVVTALVVQLDLMSVGVHCWCLDARYQRQNRL